MLVLALSSSIPQTTAQENYGSVINADALNNFPVGGQYNSAVSFSFNSTHTGALSAVRVYVRVGEGGYSGGTGGSLLFSLRADDGTESHHPSETTFASSLYAGPITVSAFPLLTFSSPVQIYQGSIYHVVITNPDADPVHNYVSLNSLLCQFEPMVIIDSNWFQLRRDGTDNWIPANYYSPEQSSTPIMGLKYVDGYETGVGYVDTWPSSPKSISNTESVRETFTVGGYDRRVSNVSVRLRRVSGTGQLTISLALLDGALLATGTINATNIDTNYCWVTYNFESVQTLIRNASYVLTVRAQSGTEYEAYPIQKGSAYGFDSTTYFKDGYAQYTTDGVTWTGWYRGFGDPDRRDSDLQFLFGGDLTTTTGVTPRPTLTEYSLAQNYPNPFNPSTIIRYGLPVDVSVRLEVFDLLGRLVRRLVDETQKAGDHQATFSSTGLASGVYIYRLEAGTFSATRRLIALK